MHRYYIRKTNRGFTAELNKAAADEIIIENKSVRSTAKKYNLCHVSLSRYVAKFKTNMNNYFIIKNIYIYYTIKI